MNLQKDEYIIIEIIPTHSNPKKGFIAQISALKLKGIKLLDRFDYRVENDLIQIPDIKNMIQYDKDNFTYTKNPNEILEKFKEWSNNIPLLILEDSYTLEYLNDLENHKELIYPYLEMEHSTDVFDKIQKKYHLVPSNHLVDLLYEAIILEENK